MKKIARIHKALADATRLRLISLISSAGELCVCDLMAVLGLPQSTISRHLAYLRDSGLVDDRRQGVWMYYSINQEQGYAAELLASMRNEFSRNQRAIKDRRQLSEYLATKKDKCE